MALVRSILNVLRGLVAAFRPLGTLLCAMLLLLLGIHAAGQPVAAVARQLLDLLDAGVDWVGTALLDVWAEVWSWGPRRRDDAVEAFTGWVDVPEKLAMVHLVGLTVEGALLLAWWRAAWAADPFELPRVPPAVMVARLRTWWRGLSRYARVERSILLGLVLAALWTLARVTRTSAVAWAANNQLVGLDWLTQWGLAAGAVAFLLGLSAAGLPLLAAVTPGPVKAGRTRRILVLLTAPLLLAALIGGLAW